LLSPLQSFQAKRAAMARLQALLDADPSDSLPARLTAAGSAHTIDAATLRRAGLYRVVKAALAAVEATGPAPGRPPPPGVLRGGREAAAALVALAPRWPRYLLLQAEVEVAAGDWGAAMRIFRAAGDAAKQQNGEGLMRAPLRSGCDLDSAWGAARAGRKSPPAPGFSAARRQRGQASAPPGLRLPAS
jgi:hypothetical protein